MDKREIVDRLCVIAGFMRHKPREDILYEMCRLVDLLDAEIKAEADGPPMDRREILEELDRIRITAAGEYLDRTRTVAALDNLAGRLAGDIGAGGPPPEQSGLIVETIDSKHKYYKIARELLDAPRQPHPSDSPLAPRMVTINEGEYQDLKLQELELKLAKIDLAERDALRAEVDTLKAELSYATNGPDGRDADRLDSLEASMGDVLARFDTLVIECNTFRDQVRRAFRQLARHGGLRRWPRPR